MKTRTIKQVVRFRANPHDVYELLMDQKKHAKFTKSRAKISRGVGEKFSIFDGGLHGTNVQLVPDKKIVQQWRSKMDGWPASYYSRATFNFTKTRGGTRLTFTHTGVPAGCYGDISEGWKHYYWRAMKNELR